MVRTLPRQLRRFGLGLLCAALLALLWQTAASARTPTQIRVGQFIPNAALTVQLQPQADNGETMTLTNLAYQQISDYQELPAGRYTLTVQSAGQTLLQTTYGLGASDRYTLAIYGLLPDQIVPNLRSPMAQLKQIFGGVDAHDSNHYLPQMTLLHDHLSSQANGAQVRLIHLAAGVVPLAVQIQDQSQSALLSSTLAYGNPSEATVLVGEATELRVAPQGDAVALLTRPISLKPNALTDIFVLGGPTASQTIEVIPAEAAPTINNSDN